MPLETATYIDDLNASNPASGDGLAQADDHLRLIKAVLQSTFPNFTAALSSSEAQLDAVVAALAAGITTAQIGDLQVTAAKIAADAVTTSKILDSNVTTAKIADLNVTEGKLAALAVAEAKIAAGAVTEAKIGDLAVSAAKLATDAVTTAKILDANVTQVKLASDSVSTAKIVDAAVTNAKLAATAKSFQGQLLHMQERIATNTSGVLYAASGWRTRQLNTTLTNEITDASHNTGTYQFTLPAGTYFIDASVLFSDAARNYVAKLRNTTDGADVLYSTNSKWFNAGGATGTGETRLRGKFTIAASKTFEIQGIGEGNSQTEGHAQSGVIGIDADVCIWKTAD